MTLSCVIERFREKTSRALLLFFAGNQVNDSRDLLPKMPSFDLSYLPEYCTVPSLAIKDGGSEAATLYAVAEQRGKVEVRNAAEQDRMVSAFQAGGRVCAAADMGGHALLVGGAEGNVVAFPWEEGGKSREAKMRWAVTAGRRNRKGGANTEVSGRN